LEKVAKLIFFAIENLSKFSGEGHVVLFKQKSLNGFFKIFSHV